FSRTIVKIVVCADCGGASALPLPLPLPSMPRGASTPSPSWLVPLLPHAASENVIAIEIVPFMQRVVPQLARSPPRKLDDNKNCNASGVVQRLYGLSVCTLRTPLHARYPRRV